MRGRFRNHRQLADRSGRVREHGMSGIDRAIRLGIRKSDEADDVDGEIGKRSGRADRELGRVNTDYAKARAAQSAAERVARVKNCDLTKPGANPASADVAACGPEKPGAASSLPGK